MAEARTRCALVLIDDDDRNVQLLARLSHADSYSVAMTVGVAAAGRRRTLRMLAKLLRSDGYVVDSSIGDWAALERLTRVPRPDVLVVDVDAELETGLGLARHARALMPSIGVVLLTDRAAELAPLAAGLRPLPFILEKPIDYAELRERLWDAAHSRTTSAIVSICGEDGDQEQRLGNRR